MDEREKAWEWRERALAAEDQLTALREAIEVDRAYNVAAMRDLVAERDRLRAVVDEAQALLRKYTDHFRESDRHASADATANVYRVLAQLDVSPNTGGGDDV